MTTTDWLVWGLLTLAAGLIASALKALFDIWVDGGRWRTEIDRARRRYYRGGPLK